jgi:L-type amino acid transporter 9
MFAYDGWNAANFITEEIINPERNLPLAIVIGVPLVTIVYILVNISYFTVMSIDELIHSPAVAITWAERVIPNAAWLIPIFVAMSTFGSGNGSLFATGRLVFVAARNGHFPELFNMVHIQKFTPIPASMLVVFIAIILIFIANVSSLITYLSFVKWIFYGMNMISLIKFRFSKQYKDLPRPFKVPLVIPIIVLLAAIFIVIVPIATDPQIEFLYAVLFMAFGYVFYIPLVHFKLQPKFMNYVTSYTQLYLQVSKPESEFGK